MWVCEMQFCSAKVFVFCKILRLSQSYVVWNSVFHFFFKDVVFSEMSLCFFFVAF